MLAKIYKAVLFSALTTIVIVLGFMVLGVICNAFTNIIQVIIFAMFCLLVWAYFDEV